MGQVKVSQEFVMPEESFICQKNHYIKFKSLCGSGTNNRAEFFAAWLILKLA
jgi:hypothetical protein